MIPDQAIEAAANAVSLQVQKFPLEQCDPYMREAYTELATAALEAALPYLEAALRQQIATELRDAQGRAPGLLAHDAKRAGYIIGMAHAARIAEEGTTK